MTERLTREEVNEWCDWVIRVLEQSHPMGLHQNKSKVNALRGMALAQAEQTKAVPPENESPGSNRATLARNTDAGAQAQGENARPGSTAPAPSEGLVERLLAAHQRMLDYRTANRFDPADWEPDDNLYHEAALSLRREAEDAARYRWLRERFNGDTWLEHSIGDLVNYELGPDAMISGPMLDAAIDQARRDGGSHE